MFITIQNDDSKFQYDTNNIKDEKQRIAANAIVHKVANLEVINEALNIASQAHRVALDKLLSECDEAKVEQPDSKA